MTEKFVRKAASYLRQSLAPPAFAFFALLNDAEPMSKHPLLQINSQAARRASLSGTRQLISNDEFSALVAILVDCNAIPRPVMATVLDRLADQLIAKARGELETEWALYPVELFERARALSGMAADMRVIRAPHHT